jgi:hypothetical protein
MNSFNVVQTEKVLSRLVVLPCTTYVTEISLSHIFHSNVLVGDGEAKPGVFTSSCI